MSYIDLDDLAVQQPNPKVMRIASQYWDGLISMQEAVMELRPLGMTAPESRELLNEATTIAYGASSVL